MSKHAFAKHGIYNLQFNDNFSVCYVQMLMNAAAIRAWIKQHVSMGLTYTVAPVYKVIRERTVKQVCLGNNVVMHVLPMSCVVAVIYVRKYTRMCFVFIYVLVGLFILLTHVVG